MLPSLLLLLAIARADPSEGSEPPPIAAPDTPADAPSSGEVGEGSTDEGANSETPTFGERVEAAKALYFRGEHEEALQRFRLLRDRLQQGEAVPEAQRDDVMLYLGEIQYLLGDRAAAWRTFEWLLRRDPEVEMSTFAHPGEVVHWFSLVQQRVRQELAAQVPEDPPPPPPMPRLPAWGYAPFGIPQFVRGDTARGWVLGGLQVALGAASVGSYVYLARINREDHPPRFTEPELVRHVNVMRFAVQWPASLGFWGTWLGSHLEARSAWRAEHAPELSITIDPNPARPSVWVVGRF